MMKRLSFAGLAVAASLVLSGCASVNMAPKEESTQAKEFKQPATGQAGLFTDRIEAASERQGKKDVSQLEMAKMGTCSGTKK